MTSRFRAINKDIGETVNAGWLWDEIPELLERGLASMKHLLGQHGVRGAINFEVVHLTEEEYENDMRIKRELGADFGVELLPAVSGRTSTIDGDTLPTMEQLAAKNN